MIGFALSTALIVTLIWATAAHAQRPIDIQHEEPKPPSGPALGASGVAVGGGGAADSGGKPQPVSPKTRGSKAPVLSPMGGLMLFVYAGVLVASGAGLVLLCRPGHGG